MYSCKCVLLTLSAIAILVQGQGSEEWRLVNLPQGPVRGRIDPNGGLYVFYNIPYATAPTGRDRFKAPLAPPVWLSTFDAVNRNIRCPQSSTQGSTQEDCLVANLFVPDTQQTNLPVLVSIHGGAYQYGNGMGGPLRELARSRNIIVVSFNYRLGVHGFLCLGTEGAPGNAGIKDQVAFLRWLNANIARFGGNPEDVTLAACSAGSGSVDVLTLSSITTGLFQKAILESGVSTGAVGLQINPVENAKMYAKVLGFNDVDDLEKLTEFYTTATYQQLTSRVDVIVDNENVGILFSPCVEKDIGQERAIADSPMNVMKQGNYTKIPLFYGFTNMEGAMRLRFFNSWKDKMNEKFSDFLPVELHFDNEEEKERVAQKVKSFYFGDAPVSEENIVQYILYFTDVLFAYPMLRSLSTRVAALGDTVYLFDYSFVDRDTPPFPHTDVRGAQHCHQSNAVRDQNVAHRTEEYIEMKEIMRDYWSSFIYTGVPSSGNRTLPQWRPANAKRSPHMELSNVIQLKDNVLGDRAAFWDNIYDEHYGGPLPPTTSSVDDDDNGAISLMISNVVFAVCLFSFYFRL